MQFRILGSPELYDEERRRRVRLTSPKQRLLLGALLSRPGAPVPTDLLVREVWGDLPPLKAANALQAHVSRLRQTLIDTEPDRANSPRLVARASGYLLQARAEEIDSSQFCLGVARAGRMAEHDPGAAYAMLRQAFKLWRGPALEGSGRGPISSAVAARLSEERQAGLEILFDCALRTGQHRQIVPELEEATTAHPLRERFYDQLMLALHRCGRQGEALGVYEQARRRFSGEAGRTQLPLLTARFHQISVQRRTPSAAAPEPPFGGGPVRPLRAVRPEDGYELDRLRDLVDRIASEQQTLRSAVERLTDVITGADGRAPHARGARGGGLSPR